MELINKFEILSENEYISNLINEGLSVRDNIINILDYLLGDIIDLVSYFTRDEKRKIISYRDINFVTSQNDHLNVLFKTIPKVYFIKSLTAIKFELEEEGFNIVNSNHRHSLLIISAFNEYLVSKNIHINTNEQYFLRSFLYYNYMKNNCNISIENYLDKLLNLIDGEMSYKQFTSALINNPVC